MWSVLPYTVPACTPIASASLGATACLTARLTAWTCCGVV